MNLISLLLTTAGLLAVGVTVTLRLARVIPLDVLEHSEHNGRFAHLGAGIDVTPVTPRRPRPVRHSVPTGGFRPA